MWEIARTDGSTGVIRGYGVVIGKGHWLVGVRLERMRGDFRQVITFYEKWACYEGKFDYVKVNTVDIIVSTHCKFLTIIHACLWSREGLQGVLRIKKIGQ